jgi:hypothetical protein
LSKNDGNTVVEELIDNIRGFLKERDWEKYHNPKDLAESICIEAAELLQIFQWVKPEESEQFLKFWTELEIITKSFRTDFLEILSKTN